MKGCVYSIVKLILWVVLRLGFGFEVQGGEHVPKEGPFILASNHVSFLDPPVIGVACPRRVMFLARADLFQHRVLGAFLRAVHVIPLHRGEGDIGAVKAAVARLREGRPIGIFPEGGRQLAGQLGTPKRGVALLAAMSKAPVIPALITGTHEALPPDARRLYRAKIRVAFGPAIHYTMTSFSPEDPTSAGKEARPDRSGLRQGCEQLVAALADRWRQLEAGRPREEASATDRSR